MTIEDKILAAAEEEFYRSGFDATSTSRIAQSVGVTHAIVNYYWLTCKVPCLSYPKIL